MKEINNIAKKNNSNIIFLSGIGLTASCIGFMIGVSSSPVVATIVPSIFALATAFIGLIQKKESQSESIQDIKFQDIEFNQKQVGLLLFVFSIAYFLGIILGIGTRIGEWHQVFYKPESKEFPWNNSKKKQPTNIANTLSWICLQERLLEKGYKSDQIRKLYDDSHDTNFLPMNPIFYSNCFALPSDTKKETSMSQTKPIVSPKIVPEPPVSAPPKPKDVSKSTDEPLW
jgi:hypothetical protein